MVDRFIKFIPSDRTEYLLRHHHNAFILLTYIAMHARRTNELDDGLMPGDAILPGNKPIGLTPKEYLNAIKKLIELGFIEIVYNKHARPKIEKRAIKRAIETMVANIINTDTYDINIEDKGEPKGERGANQGRTKGDKQERTRMNNKEKEVVCSAPPLVGEAAQENEKIIEKCEKRHPDGSTLKITLNEMISESIMNNKNFTLQEISQAWKVLVEYDGPIRVPLRFIEGTIENIRNAKSSKVITKKEKDKKECQEQQVISKEEPSKRKLVYLRDVMKELA